MQINANCLISLHLIRPANYQYPGIRMKQELRENVRKEDSFGAVNAQYESMTVKNEIFDRFMDSCKKSDQPNQNLVDALAVTRAWQVEMNADV